MIRFCILLIASVFFTHCAKELAEGDPNTIPSDLTVISQGSFTNGAHVTTGIVKLSKDASGKRFLVFENFKTDSGPDIRIWAAEDRDAKNYVELSKTVQLGNYKIDVPSDYDATKKPHILIWCKAFSVLFGGAQLK